MGEEWPWWAVVIGSRDWYVYYTGTVIVKARNAKEAKQKGVMAYAQHAGLRNTGHLESCAVIGPFDEMPQIR